MILKGVGYSLLIANVILSWRIYVNKAMVLWPLATVPLSYMFISPVYKNRDIVYSRSTTKNSSICVTLERSFIWVPKGMKCLKNATVSLIAKTSDA